VRDVDAALAFYARLGFATRRYGAEVHGPEDTEWGKHEGALDDPDGNVIPSGSPLAPG